MGDRRGVGADPGKLPRSGPGKLRRRGAGVRGARAAATDPARNTLARAAALIGQPAARLRTDSTQNIRGGAALLADEARHAGVRPGTLSDWYPVIARLSGASGSSVLADDVFDTLRAGVADKHLQLAAQRGLAAPGRRIAAADAAECPADLNCRFVPAAYVWNDTSDANGYGNYDPADRPADGNKVRYVVIHDTEGTYDSTVQWFQDPNSYTSAHYVIRSSDGAVTQMVRNKDIAWHAGNWNINAESIGIEHEGVAVDGATWYTDAMYRSSAKLVRYLAKRYGIPLDRQHILGHDDVAHDGRYADSHWDPGPFWDWNRYMKLLGAPPPPKGDRLVTVAPKFTGNRPPLRYCPPEGSPCRDLPAQPTNSLLLRTEPRDDAPLPDRPHPRRRQHGHRGLDGQGGDRPAVRGGGAARGLDRDLVRRAEGVAAVGRLDARQRRDRQAAPGRAGPGVCGRVPRAG
jgi:hypothetical protein